VGQKELGTEAAGKAVRSLRSPHSHGRRNLYPTPRTVWT
jgi:hypothetical protein